ncbi:MAG: glycosyltransferase family 87 protein [bacterium]|nr:glycosyltransferase family 87 protein [bacterium]
MAKLLTPLSIIFFSLSFLVILRVFFLGVYPDFTVYYNGSLSFLHGQNPYIKTPDYFSNYVYPPFAVLLFLPFSLIDPHIASLLFTFISLLSAVFGVYFCLKALREDKASVFLIATALLFLAFPTKFTFGMGQVNLVVFLLLSLAFFFWKRRNPIIAGVFLGLCFSIKLFPFLLLVYFLLRKDWRILVSSAITFVVIAVLTGLITGFSLYSYFFQNILPGIASSYQSGYYNQALSGFFARLPLDREIGMVLKTSISLLFIVATFLIVYLRRKNQSLSSLMFTILITLSLIVNPFSWQHHFVWLILPFLVTFYAIKRRDFFSYIFLFLSYVLIAMNIRYPDTLYLLLQSHVLFGAILLWLLQLKLLWDKK